MAPEIRVLWSLCLHWFCSHWIRKCKHNVGIGSWVAEPKRGVPTHHRQWMCDYCQHSHTCTVTWHWLLSMVLIAGKHRGRALNSSLISVTSINCRSSEWKSNLPPEWNTQLRHPALSPSHCGHLRMHTTNARSPSPTLSHSVFLLPNSPYISLYLMSEHQQWIPSTGHDRHFTEISHKFEFDDTNFFLCWLELFQKFVETDFSILNNP